LAPPKAFSVGDTTLYEFHYFTITTKLVIFTTKLATFTTKFALTKIPIRNTHQATADGAIQALFSSQSRDIGVQNLEYYYHFTLNQKLAV